MGTSGRTTEGKKALGSKWVYKINPETSRMKSRLVVLGYNQVAGVHYDETYAPVANYGTSLGWDIGQYDVKTAV
jgi:hypothetical protein